MYLKSREYVSGYDHSGDEEKSRYEAVLEAVGLTGFGAKYSPGATVEITVAYWRKSNQIHNWFVQNVQDGVDECEPHDVTREQLKELRDLCQKAIDGKDSEILPPQEGFFFGGTEIDSYYWSDLEETIEQLDKVLSIPEEEHRWRQFFYRSSW